MRLRRRGPATGEAGATAVPGVAEAAPVPPVRPMELDEALLVGAYRVLLRRDPTDAERRHWMERLQGGLPLEQMLAGLLDTEEFLVRHEELHRRAGISADERERLAIVRRLAILEDRVEALVRAEETRGRTSR